MQSDIVQLEKKKASSLWCNQLKFIKTHYQGDGFVHVGAPEHHGLAHQALGWHARQARLLRQHLQEHLARRARVLM